MIFPPVEDHPTTPVIRLVRRICLLRELGDAAGARSLENEPLAAAVQTARAKLGPDALSENELNQIFARESERATETVTMAEVIIRQLAPGAASASSANTRVTRVHELPRAMARPAASGDAPAIADLLDAMLANESRAGSR